MPKVKKATPVKVKAKAKAKKVVVKAVKPVKVAIPKKSGLTADVYNLLGKKTGTVEIPKEIYAAKGSDLLLAQAVRVYLANQRQGNQSVQTRADVTGSTRKIYKQKGTGRARHGDRKAPIFVGGGVAHGPKPRDYTLKLNKKQKRRALLYSLATRFKKDDIIFVDKLLNMQPKTSEMHGLLKSLNLDNRRNKILMVYTHDNSKNFKMASRNLENVSLRPVSDLTSYDVLLPQKLIFEKESLQFLKNRYASK